MSNSETLQLTQPLLHQTELGAVALAPAYDEVLEPGFIPGSSMTPSTAERTSNSSWMTTIRRGLGRVGLAVSVLTGGAVSAEAIAATPAVADTAVTQQVYGTSDEGLYLHPSSPELSSPVSDLLPDGTNFDVNCWTNSAEVLGDTIWLHGTNEATGNTGYLSDAYINTPVTTDNEGPQLTAIGIPECGSTVPSANTNTSSSDSLQPAASLPPFLSFDRNAETNWALAHAEDTPPNDGSCTIFVSEALWAGGVPQTKEWNNSPNLIHGGVRNGTDDAWAAENFMEYMKTEPFVKVESLGHMSPSNNNVPDAKLGDIMGYDWNNDGSIDHLDVITGFSGQYPLVSGWSEDGAKKLTYNQRGWTYSQEEHTWLQMEKDSNGNYPNMNMTASLIHIRDEDDINLQ
jgi:hypothetical protein